MYVAVIKYDEKGKPVILETLGEGSVEQWKLNFQVAKEAIEFQEKYTEIEKFNAIHLNLLLTDLIKRNVITNQGININPLVLPIIEKETARTAWRWSKKKRLMKYFELKNQELSGVVTKTVWKGVKKEGIKKAWNWLYGKLPRFIQNIIELFKELNKKFESYE